MRLRSPLLCVSRTTREGQQQDLPSPPCLAEPGAEKEPGSRGCGRPAFGLVGEPSSPQFPKLQWLIDNRLFTSVICSCWWAEPGSWLVLQRLGELGRNQPHFLRDWLPGGESQSELPAPVRTEPLCPRQVPLSTDSAQTKQRPSSRSPALRPGHDLLGHTLSSQEAGCRLLGAGAQ